MRIKHKSALSLILFTAFSCTIYAQESAAQDWEQNEHITKLTKIELGQWTVPDTVKIKWTDKYGKWEIHNYPSCYLLDLKEENGDVTPGKSYVLKDMAEMFGPDGLLKDGHDNLDRLMQSPLMSATRLVYTAKGGPVDVDYMFGSGGFGNRLCYFYVPADSEYDKTTLSVAQTLADNKIPTFCIADQMRTSIHMDRFEKQNGEWTKINEVVGNSALGDKLNDPDKDGTYGGWGDNLITGKRFRLKYFGDDYTGEPTDVFPEGTRIYFFLATYNQDGWNGVASEGVKPYSIKFAYRQLNREFGSQGKWDFEHYDAHKKKYDTYGPGIFAAAAVNFTYTDSEQGILQNVQFQTWEDFVQPDPDAEKKVGDFDMGDVGFGLYGVKNPLFDVISESTIKLQTIQEAKDYQDQFEGDNKGAWKNAYRYKFILTNGDENGENKVYSRGLQPVTFTQDNAATGEGHFNPAYTWASIRRFTDDSEVGEVVKFVVIKKTASLPKEWKRAPIVEDLNNPDLIYSIQYAMTDTYDETKVPETWDGKWYIDGQEKDCFEHRRGNEIDKTALPLEKMTSLYHDAVETLNPEGKYINSKRFWMMFAFRDGIRVRTNESAVASPRAEVVIEPRGTAETIDLDGSETKHLESLDGLAPIDNRTFFTLTYNPQTELYGKEHISALFIVNEEGKRFCKIKYDKDKSQWVTEVENSGHADNQNSDFKILDVIDESATRRHFVLSTNLAPDKKFGVMVETERDLWFDGVSVIKNNTFGGYPAECQMPTLSFDKADLYKNGVCEHGGKQSYVMYVNTEWSLKGASVPGQPVFSQWRTYNNPAYPWDNKESAYLNILYDNQAATGTIPAEAYENWLGSYDNELISTGDGSWKNHDILAQLNEGVTDVNGEYVVRAYFPSTPAILPKLMKAKAAEAPVNTSYVVLEAKKPFNAVRNELTTVIETITADADAPAVYYNLRGQRVAAPVAGELYIVRRGTQVSKEIVR